MEKIEKRKDTFYYGDKACSNAGEAYGLFREDYHKELGKRVYRRLNRVGQREERVHGFGSYYPVKYSDELAEKYGNTGRVRSYLMGIVDISYCRMVGIWDMPDISDDECDAYLDWLVDRKSNALYLVGRNVKTGRTATRKKKYR